MKRLCTTFDIYISKGNWISDFQNFSFWETYYWFESWKSFQTNWYLGRFFVMAPKWYKPLHWFTEYLDWETNCKEVQIFQKSSLPEKIN